MTSDVSTWNVSKNRIWCVQLCGHYTISIACILEILITTTVNQYTRFEIKWCDRKCRWSTSKHALNRNKRINSFNDQVKILLSHTRTYTHTYTFVFCFTCLWYIRSADIHTQKERRNDEKKEGKVEQQKNIRVHE